MTSAARWYTGPLPRSGPEAYVHLVRAADDPVRPGADKDESRGWNQTGGRTALERDPPAYHAQSLRQHLADGQPRTFNRLMVELHGVTADLAFRTNADAGLWALVTAGEVEHTSVAPVRFRLREPYDTPNGVLGVPINPARPRWSAPEPHDDRCDRCRVQVVPCHDETLCPHTGCHWSARVCEPCGGFAVSRQVLAEHLGQCAFARAVPNRLWDDAGGVFVATTQLSLF